MSNLKVFVLLAGMVALFGVVGGMLGGQNGMLSAYRGGLASLFSTHPPTEERIARLQAIAHGEPPRA